MDIKGGDGEDREAWKWGYMDNFLYKHCFPVYPAQSIYNNY